MERRIQVGSQVWVPCEVKPGPFSNERLVRVEETGGAPWIGFVEVDALKEPVKEGRTSVRVVVVELGDGWFRGRYPGQALSDSMQFEGALSQIVPG